VGSSRRRIDGLEAIQDAYQVDGAILFATPACRQSNAAWRILKDATDSLHMPFLMLDMDIGDPRGYSPQQVRTRLEGFIELMDNR
jgi:Benzoyl-CoA reductase/2-hydroxyglutaryl-CoA dehydratase subunit, BcrC/BadD/HgdB